MTDWEGLQREAAAAGLPPAAFWELTPKEYAVHVAGVAQAHRDELNRLLSAAWMGEALHRQKRLPRLKKILVREPRRRRKLTQQELEARCNDVFGALAGSGRS